MGPQAARLLLFSALLQSVLPPAAPANGRRPDRLLQAGHTGSIQALAFSPDGKWLASGGFDNTVVVWNAATGDEQRKLTGHTADIAELAFSPDGRHLASVGSNGGIKVWDPLRGTALYSLALRGATHLTYSPDGVLWAAAASAATARIEIHDAATGKTTRSLPSPWSNVTAMTITPGGLLIAAGSVDEHDAEGSVQVWNLGSAALVKSYPVTAIAFSADGLSMARVEFFPQARVVISDLSTGRQRQSIPARGSGPGSVSFSPDGKAIAVIDNTTSQVKLWSVSTGSELTTIPGEKAIGATPLTTAAFSADGKLLAAAPYGASSIKSWDVAAGRERRTFYGQGLVQGIAFSPDGRSLVAGSQQGLSVWDVAAGKRVATLFSGPVNMVVFSRDGRWLAANGGARFSGETLKVWDMKSRTLAADFTFGAGGTPVSSIAFAGAGSPLTTLGPFSRSWQFTVDGETHTVWSGTSPLAATPDEKLLAAQAGIGGSLDVWDMTSGKKLTTLAALPVSISAVAFSGDGRWLMAAGAETRATARDAAGTAVVAWGIKVWDVGTWKEQLHRSFSATGAPCAAFSPDSRQLAIQESWEVIEIVDVERGASIGVFAGKDPQPQYHQFSAGDVAFSPDGTLLLQGAQNGIRVWKLTRP